MIALLTALMCTALAQASTILATEPVSVGDERSLLGWVESLGDSPEQLVCRPIVELPGALLCAAANMNRMNSVFARISMFAEGIYGSKRGEVAEFGTKPYLTAMALAGGHDLRGLVVSGFFSEVERQCQGNLRICLSKEEESFRSQVVHPISMVNPNFVVLAVSAEVSEDLPLLLSHELWHAAFFLNDGYRASVYAYWKTLQAQEQARIRKALSATYDSSDEELMVNEFQAHLLQKDGHESILAAFHARHFPKLKKIADKLRIKF